MNQLILRVGAWSAALAALCLAIQFAIGASIGAALADLNSLAPGKVTALLATHGESIKWLYMFDDIFPLLYATAFIGLAEYLRERAPAFARIALVFGLLTATADWFENSIVLSLTMLVQAAGAIDAAQLFALNIIAQMKYLFAGIAVFLFGVSLWDASRVNRAASIIALMFVPVNALAFINGSASLLRLLGMFALLVATALVLRVAGKR